MKLNLNPNRNLSLDILKSGYTIPHLNEVADVVSKWMYADKYSDPRLVNKDTEPLMKAAILMADIYHRVNPEPDQRILDLFSLELTSGVVSKTLSSEDIKLLEERYTTLAKWLFRSHLKDAAFGNVWNKYSQLVSFQSGDHVLLYDIDNLHVVLSMLKHGCSCVVYNHDLIWTALVQMTTEVLGWTMGNIYDLSELATYDKAIIKITDYIEAAQIQDLLEEHLTSKGEAIVDSLPYINNAVNDGWVDFRSVLIENGWLKSVHNERSSIVVKDSISRIRWVINKKAKEKPILFDSDKEFSIAEDRHWRYIPKLKTEGVALSDIIREAKVEIVELRMGKYPMPVFQKTAVRCEEKSKLETSCGKHIKTVERCLGVKIMTDGIESVVDVCKVLKDIFVNADVPGVNEDNKLFRVRNPKKCNADYLLWALTQPEFFHQCTYMYCSQGWREYFENEDFYKLKIPLPPIEVQKQIVQNEIDREIKGVANTVSNEILRGWSLNQTIDTIQNNLRQTHGDIFKNATISIEPTANGRVSGTKGKYQIEFIITSDDRRIIQIPNRAAQVLYVFLLLHHDASYTKKSLRDSIHELYGIYNTLFAKDRGERTDGENKKIADALNNLLAQSIELVERKTGKKKIVENNNFDQSKSAVNKALKSVVDSPFERGRFNINYISGGLSVTCTKVQFDKSFTEEMEYWIPLFEAERDYFEQAIKKN